MKSLPASVSATNENSMLTIASSSNKSLLFRFLNEQVEEGFYALVIDYLKENDFDLSAVNVDEETRSSCTKLYELSDFVQEYIKKPERYEIEDWIEPLFKFVYGDIDPNQIDAPVAVSGVYRYSIWLIYLYQCEKFEVAMRLIGEKIAPQLINTYFQVLEIEERPKCFDKAIMGYLDLISVVMDIDVAAQIRSPETYLNNLEVLYDYLIEDENVPSDYKLHFSMGLFNEFVRNLNYEKAFEFYGLNAEFIPIDNLKVYDSFKDLIRHCDNAQYTNFLNRAVVTAISKQDIYNRRIDGLIAEVSQFIKKVYKFIEDEPVMKKNLQVLGAGQALTDKSNIFEGLYEYNLIFYECGIKALVNQDVSSHSWEEKYEILELLYTTLNVLFDGYNVYELSNRIEHQYVELNWTGTYVNSNPTLLKNLFSIKEKIKAFKVRKNSIVEKNKANFEIKKLLEDRQKHLVFIAADEMIKHGLNNGKINIINSNYDTKKAEKMFLKTYGEIKLGTRYAQESTEKGSLFGNKLSQSEQDALRLLRHPHLSEMIYKSEWLWNQYLDKGVDKQTPEERTYSVACLIKAVEILISRKAPEEKKEDGQSKRVIITKTGKVIELSDESNQTTIAAKPESNVITYINNVDKFLIDKSEEKVAYVRKYLDDWIKALMEKQIDKDKLLDLNDAEDFRSHTLKVIKKLHLDLIPM